jgi:glycosyltransferase involved in cell wall biosynthesis
MRKSDVSCRSGGWQEKTTELYHAIRHRQLSRLIDLIRGRMEYPVSVDRESMGSKPVPAGSLLLCPDIGELNPEDRKEFLRKVAGDLDKALLCIITCDVGPHTRNIPPGMRLSSIKEDVEVMFSGKGFRSGFDGYCPGMAANPAEKQFIWIRYPDRASRADRQKVPDAFTVVAIIATYNEEDIIAEVIRKLADQKIAVYVIDNWSTDSTAEILKDLFGQGILSGFERYPVAGPSDTYDLRGILGRKEELAREFSADWVIHQDADEIRVSPWPGRDLKKAIYLVDEMGYSAIDHTLINFVPVDGDGFTQDLDPESYFSYFRFGSSSLPRINTWKRQNHPVDLASSGGHEVRFPGRRVFPFNFLIKHYPVRSQAHGERKFFKERQSRSSLEKEKLGWHVHYFWYENGHSFIENPEELLVFNPDQFPENYLIERLSSIRPDRGEIGKP